MKFLLTVDDSAEVTGIPVGYNITGVGSFVFTPNEPLEIDSDFLAGKIVDALWYNAVVEVPSVKDKWTGIKLDVPAAIADSTVKLKDAHKIIFKQYKEAQLDRAKANYPAVMPEGLAAYVVRKYDINLAAHGLKTVGADPFEAGIKPHDNGGNDIALAALREENRMMNVRMNEMMEAMEKLVAAKAEPEKKQRRSA